MSYYCYYDKTGIENRLRYNLLMFSDIVNQNDGRELKTFMKYCRNYHLGKEDQTIINLCNERVNIYIDNDNTTQRIRNSLETCDTLINILKENNALLKALY